MRPQLINTHEILLTINVNGGNEDTKLGPEPPK